MASATHFIRPLEIRSKKEVLESPSPEKCRSFLDLGITLALFLWPSLTLAVNSSWGGPESSAKREWFASATIDLIAENPDADADWIEEFLLNVMFDEFEVNVEDDSAFDIAEAIVRLRKDCAQGEWAEVLSMKKKWDAKNQGGSTETREFIRIEDLNAETSEEEEYESETEKYVAPQLIKMRKSVELDEDGFTKVTRKKR